MENEQTKSRWTPEMIIQAFKEIVTAIFGVMILVFTLVLASKTFGFVSNPEQIARAKDILLLMIGLAGVVVGYYFGRVPADARASQAQEKADAAGAHAGQVNAAADEAVKKIEKILSRHQTEQGFTKGTTTPVAGNDTVADLQEIRDNLQNLAAMRRH